MQITLVMPSLSCGGAERVGAAMANYWVEQGKEVTLITFDAPQSTPFYELSPKLHYLKLGLLDRSGNLVAGVRNNFKRIFALRTSLKASQADVVVSILGRSNIRVLFATMGLKMPIIVCEQIDPARDSLSFFWKALRFLTYLRAKRIVVLTERYAEYFPRHLRKRIRVIPNPIVFVELPDKASVTPKDSLKLIAVGRLELQKGFDTLLQALAELNGTTPNWTLTVLGEGSQRQSLEALREELKLTERVSFVGTVKNVPEFLQHSDLFILSSRVEGFPLALCEAMACGVPVIATDCAASIREIVRDGIDGIIVPSETAKTLALAISDLMNNPERRREMARRGLEITKKLNLSAIMSNWEKLLSEVVG
jgi:glycosyltransferase involved in cell wall biosynthesis